MKKLVLIIVFLSSFSASTFADENNLTFLKTEFQNNRYNISNFNEFFKKKTIVEAARFKDGKKKCSPIEIDNELGFKYLTLSGKLLITDQKSISFKFDDDSIPERTIKMGEEYHLSKMNKTNPYYKGDGFTLNNESDSHGEIIARAYFINCSQSHSCKKWCGI